jgi:hypothetical protein
MDLATAQAHLDAWVAADLAVSTGQSYSIAGRSLSRVDATTIREQIAYWSRIVSQLTAAQSPSGEARPGITAPVWR